MMMNTASIPLPFFPLFFPPSGCASRGEGDHRDGRAERSPFLFPFLFPLSLFSFFFHNRRAERARLLHSFPPFLFFSIACRRSGAPQDNGWDLYRPPFFYDVDEQARQSTSPAASSFPSPFFQRRGSAARRSGRGNQAALPSPSLFFFFFFFFSEGLVLMPMDSFRLAGRSVSFLGTVMVSAIVRRNSARCSRRAGFFSVPFFLFFSGSKSLDSIGIDPPPLLFFLLFLSGYLWEFLQDVPLGPSSSFSPFFFFFSFPRPCGDHLIPRDGAAAGAFLFPLLLSFLLFPYIGGMR